MKEKIKKFYNSDFYIKIIYGIPALVSGGFAFILLTIFTIQIIHQSFFEEEISYEEMISQYRYCLLYTSPSPRDVEESRMPSSA